MNKVALPDGRIALCFVNPNDLRNRSPDDVHGIPAYIDLEWMRAFAALVTRTGGTVAETAPDILLLAETLEAQVNNSRTTEIDGLRRAVCELQNELKTLRASTDLRKGLAEIRAEVETTRWR